MKEYYTEAQLRKHQKNNHEIALEVEIQNFNYDEPFDPFFMKFQMAFITDKGEEAYSISSLPLDPIKKERVPLIHFP